MTTVDFATHLFCLVDDKMTDIPKHPQSKLYPSELVMLFALKGVNFSAFYRWLKRDYQELFHEIPERTRLMRLLRTRQVWCQHFLDEPSFFTIIDSYGIELIHPCREGRSIKQVGRKGKSNYRWIIGVKLCYLINSHGKVVAWEMDTANVYDQRFHPMIEAVNGKTIALSDLGFRSQNGVPDNLKLCPPKTWNERMTVETILSMLAVVYHIKHWFHRSWRYLKAHAAYLAALFNTLLDLNRLMERGASAEDMLLHIAQYSL